MSQQHLSLLIYDWIDLPLCRELSQVSLLLCYLSLELYFLLSYLLNVRISFVLTTRSQGFLQTEFDLDSIVVILHHPIHLLDLCRSLLARLNLVLFELL
jgi:hypothetical protein